MELIKKTTYFYFHAKNAIDRILVGDLVLINMAESINAENVIVLTLPDLTLQRTNGVAQGDIIGVVVGIAVNSIDAHNNAHKTPTNKTDHTEPSRNNIYNIGSKSVLSG
ncbi:hypothetical protein [Paenibacillus brasilensis]|uniref:Uncharacterized protein n=1 Tax=Paenibacillus brasilensis TaxID=128574 RepID=A0ABU0L508_9BACL|nr:hypothetical protein [Paenibacillus brasilensis]MDQ0496360.1 hypothetical protein [Paenibacillus brasilensis]